MNMFLIFGADNGINPSNILVVELNGTKSLFQEIYLN